MANALNDDSFEENLRMTRRLWRLLPYEPFPAEFLRVIEKRLHSMDRTRPTQAAQAAKLSLQIRLAGRQVVSSASVASALCLFRRLERDEQPSQTKRSIEKLLNDAKVGYEILAYQNTSLAARLRIVLQDVAERAPIIGWMIPAPYMLKLKVYHALIGRPQPVEKMLRALSEGQDKPDQQDKTSLAQAMKAELIRREDQGNLRQAEFYYNSLSTCSTGHEVPLMMKHLGLAGKGLEFFARNGETVEEIKAEIQRRQTMGQRWNLLSWRQRLFVKIRRSMAPQHGME